MNTDHDIPNLEEITRGTTTEGYWNYTPTPLFTGPIGKFYARIMPIETRIITTSKNKQCLMWALEILGPPGLYTQCKINKFSTTETLGIKFTKADFMAIGIRMRSFYKIHECIHEAWGKHILIDVIPEGAYDSIKFLRLLSEEEEKTICQDPNYIPDTYMHKGKK